MKNIPSNKASRGNIHIKIFKKSGFTFQILRDCINDAINNSVFPESLQATNYFYYYLFIYR